MNDPRNARSISSRLSFPHDSSREMSAPLMYERQDVAQHRGHAPDAQAQLAEVSSKDLGKSGLSGFSGVLQPAHKELQGAIGDLDVQEGNSTDTEDQPSVLESVVWGWDQTVNSGIPRISKKLTVFFFVSCIPRVLGADVTKAAFPEANYTPLWQHLWLVFLTLGLCAFWWLAGRKGRPFAGVLMGVSAVARVFMQYNEAAGPALTNKYILLTILLTATIVAIVAQCWSMHAAEDTFIIGSSFSAWAWGEVLAWRTKAARLPFDEESWGRRGQGVVTSLQLSGLTQTRDSDVASPRPAGGS
ncbi:hypothetical protein LTR16_001536 [Cryomyces antarcticus]|uniref:Uncharacterized protein n=1 Tax=Cryomyces antarcticus TaxID=329879 RepID=A0ABR0KVR2_9PEZI|nr:hypothetical protein LTR16_001536 [Cryomyces antarcticus]